MTLQQLEYIRAVDKYGHFGKAAEACGVTQPTLSLMIKKLEEELDVQIFDRDAHPVTATEVGRKIIDKAGVVLFNSQQLQEVAGAEKDVCSGQVTIAAISTVIPILVTGIFKHIRENHSEVQPIMEEMLSATIIEKLKKAEIDMGILRSPVDDPALMEIPLFHEKFLAYVSPDNPLSARTELESSRLLDHQIWIMKGGIRQFERSMLADGETFNYDDMYEGGRVGSLIGLVNDIGGLTIVPELHTPLLLYSQQVNLKPIVNPTRSRTVSLIIRKDYAHERMLNIVIDSIKSIIPVANQDEMIRQNYIRL